jgi:predicted TIM-barrel fold metal-dependent hydrolase
MKLAGVAGLLGASRLSCYRLARPAPPDGPLSNKARALLARCWDGIDPSRVLDCHAHVIGLGAGGTGAFVHPHLRQWLRHPLHYARFSVYVMASGVDDLEKADLQYVERLVSLVRAQEKHGRMLLLAFDRAHGDDGTPDLEATEFYTPNDYVLRLSREYPDCFVAAASIHPYRKDAVDELERMAAQGIAAVKWLPNAQRINPGSPRCAPFFRKLADLKVPLLTHAGEEKAVEAEDAQWLGNPLLLRRALDAGVTVLVAHCASAGTGEDLDAAEGARPWLPNFDLFLRLMGEPSYRDRLFGDVSALLLANRCETLKDVLRREELHSRLVNGTDYPLPAINVINRTGKLVSLGLLTEEERALLNEIDRHNPLDFDFAMKRTVRLRAEGRELRFPDSVFMARPGMFPGV